MQEMWNGLLADSRDLKRIVFYGPNIRQCMTVYAASLTWIKELIG